MLLSVTQRRLFLWTICWPSRLSLRDFPLRPSMQPMHWQIHALVQVFIRPCVSTNPQLSRGGADEAG